MEGYDNFLDYLGFLCFLLYMHIYSFSHVIGNFKQFQSHFSVFKFMPVLSMRFSFDDQLINTKELEQSNLIVGFVMLTLPIFLSSSGVLVDHCLKFLSGTWS